jgi:hypothetical protein
VTLDATYTTDPQLAPARHLQRAGLWDLALAAIPAHPRGPALRAEILVDRHQWCLDPVDETIAAVAALADQDPALARYLTAQLEYWRRLLGLGDRQLGEDPTAAFATLADHGRLGGWAVFSHAVTLDNLYEDPAGASAGYARAFDRARSDGDRLLESYVVRHQAGHVTDGGDGHGGLALLRRSLHLRAALAARPQTAAAQAALADALAEARGGAAEADELREIVAATAAELNLTWLKTD